jgi:hypothetical protein
MNKYKCFYDNDETIVEATTSANAQIAGYNVFQQKYPRRKIKAYQVTPALIERNGQEIDLISNFI